MSKALLFILPNGPAKTLYKGEHQQCYIKNLLDFDLNQMSYETTDHMVQLLPWSIRPFEVPRFFLLADDAPSSSGCFPRPTQTPRMGDQGVGSSNPPHGGVFDLVARGPVVGVRTLTGSILNAWWFIFDDGSTSNQLGGNYPGGGDHSFSYPDEILSSIKIMGVSNYYKSADCAVFGFKFKQEQTLPEPAVLRTMYVASPAKISPLELARSVGAEDIDKTGNLIQEWSNFYHWDTMRQNHWDRIQTMVDSQGK
ncbi:hypothetical protein FE783_15985 [Paenibacillus mesophilus]|uniref:hypothetical protein n=1 Tax=Paenibacillus mesophilus TaxID=2582849 RepID=UPI00110E9303|nr:hypothetical protein [Paenibacillus mesophilus]TMV48562.1 hypothetical protein FE783_15985 [Paenibacillus mesophilus]